MFFMEEKFVALMAVSYSRCVSWLSQWLHSVESDPWKLRL